MPKYTQEDRPLKVFTVLEDDTLMLEGIQGVEAISTPYSYRLDLVSEDPDLDPTELLGQPLSVGIKGAKGWQTVNGLISRFYQLGEVDDLVSYRATVVPHLWFLSLKRDCRVFQHESVDAIVSKVFDEHGLKYEWRLMKSYEPREYCVQYRESDLDFVSRLLEEEGIYYFFEHGKEGLLVLTDDNGKLKDAALNETVVMRSDAHRDHETVGSLLAEHSVHSRKVTLRDYDFLQPSLDLTDSEESAHDFAKHEVYDYPGEFVPSTENATAKPADGRRYARLLLEAEEARSLVAHGSSDCRGFVPGAKFTIEEHFKGSLNLEYVLTQVALRASVDGFRAGVGLEFENDFVAIPSSVTYRPRRKTTRPVVQGIQTAVVVGPAGEEVYTNKNGCVKVQFHWDRVGKHDDKSSCWVRVATPWGGKGYGAVSIPRIGNEVLIDFLEGDPDRPMIIGSVYNAEQTLPYALPDHDIQMGMKSRSSKGGGGYNEFVMDDTKGKELVRLHSQFDMDTTVENDQRQVVHNNRTAAVDVDESMSVGANQSLAVGANRTVSVEADHTETVSGKQDVHVVGDRSIKVDANQATEVTGNRSAKITGNDTGKVTGNLSRKVTANVEIEADAKVGIKGTAGVMVESPAMITVKAPVVQVGDKVITIEGQMIVLKAGGSQIAITPAGIVMNGPMITSAASAMNKVMGAVVMIN